VAQARGEEASGLGLNVCPRAALMDPPIFPTQLMSQPMLMGVMVVMPWTTTPLNSGNADDDSDRARNRLRSCKKDKQRKGKVSRKRNKTRKAAESEAAKGTSDSKRSSCAEALKPRLMTVPT
jgi:hypothetical protein